MFLFWFGAVFSAPALAAKYTARLALGVLAADAGFLTPVPAVPADQFLIPYEPRGSPFVPFKPGHLSFCFVHSLPPVSVSSAGEPLPVHSTTVLRTARLFRTAYRSNRCPTPAIPHTGISANPQHRSSSQGPPVPQSPPLKPLPDAIFPAHRNLRQPTAPQLFARPTCSAQPAFFHTRLPPLWKITRRCPRSSGWGGSPSSPSTHSPPVRSGSADRTGTPPIPFWAPPAPGRCSGRSCRCSASRRRCGD